MRNLLRDLENQITMNHFQQKTYEGKDQDIHRICINAEKVLRRGQCTKYMWSPILDNADTILQYCKLRKKHITNVNKTGFILLQSKELDIVDCMTTPETTIDEKLCREVQ